MGVWTKTWSSFPCTLTTKDGFDDVAGNEDKLFDLQRFGDGEGGVKADE